MLASTANWILPGRVDGYGEDPPAWMARRPASWTRTTSGALAAARPGFGGAFFAGTIRYSWIPPRFRPGRAGRPPLGADSPGAGARAPPGGTGQPRPLDPRSDLASTGYCLANSGLEYLIYQPKPGETFSVEMKAGKYRYEWIDPRKMWGGYRLRGVPRPGPAIQSAV